MNARIVNVILLEHGDERTYFTLEGIQLASIKGGSVTSTIEPLPQPKQRGGVVKNLSPKEYKHEQLKEKERELTLEQRLAYEKKHNTLPA